MRAREEFEVREKSYEVGESIALERAPLGGQGASPDPKFSGSALPVEVLSSLLPSSTAAAERLLYGAAHDPVAAVPGPDAAAEKLLRGWRLIACVFLPFAAGFYISYLFRSINALISGDLTSDLGLSAADLGLLTSVYFLTFAVAQLPIGVLLDRYGPRRVQSALLLVAAAGAAMFATSEGFAALVLARALIGLGVAAALTAGLKAIVQWFPRERVALANGSIVMLGALGAVTATAPADLVLDWVGWRGLFELLAVATAGIAAVIYFVVPDTAAAKACKRSASISLKTVYSDERFWRLAPLSAACAGSAWAMQGLWAAPWLTDVEGVDRPDLVRHLFVMGLAVCAGSFLMGAVADRLGRRGIGPQALLAIVALIFIATQLALILRLPLPSYLLWTIVAAAGTGHVLSYTILAERFPKEVAGRANAALNVLHFGAAFVLQYSIGLVLDQWMRVDGHYPTIAYQVAFGLVIALQFVALVWFELPQARRWWSDFRSRLRGHVFVRFRAASSLAQPIGDLPHFGRVDAIPLVPDLANGSTRESVE
jgi:predicted MFS family arabinose efflux permease